MNARSSVSLSSLRSTSVLATVVTGMRSTITMSSGLRFRQVWSRNPAWGLRCPGTITSISLGSSFVIFNRAAAHMPAIAAPSPAASRAAIHSPSRARWEWPYAVLPRRDEGCVTFPYSL
jgi:hypothetical protein